MPRRHRNAVPIVADREDAGVVPVAFLEQDVERPQRSRGDRIARRAVAEHAPCRRRPRARPSRAARPRETPRASGRRSAGARSRATRPRGPTPAMRRTRCGKPLGDPAEHEERASTPYSSKISSRRSVFAAHAALEVIPLVSRHDAVEDADVEVILHVDGHGIDHAARSLALGRCIVRRPSAGSRS